MLIPKKPKSAKKEKDPPAEKRFWKWFETYSYRTFGRRFEERNKDMLLAEKLRRANLSLTPGLYTAMVVMAAIIAASVSGIASVLLFFVILGLESALIITIIVVGLATLMAATILPMSVSMRISNRKAKIDRELPFTLSELSIMASTGLSPVQVIRRMATRSQNQAMMNEFRKIVYKIDIEGKDIITSLGETAKETPSDAFRETLWDLSNMIHQGGDLDIYLRVKADEIMALKRDLQREFIDKLATYSDIYISLVLVGVLFLVIAAFLIDAMGSNFGGIDSNMLLIMLTFFLIPVAAIAIGLVVTSAYSKTE